jgi:uncharacterized membrane-anchored protein
MANITYSNLPESVSQNSKTDIFQVYDTYYDKPIEIYSSVYNATKAFFTSKGFDEVSAESVAITIIKQAKKDGYNPLEILDSLKGLSSVEISALVAEIINFNRYKTSFLGYSLVNRTNAEISRNILP